MTDLVATIENALGERLQTLRRREDDYQNFWVGVLEHRKDVDESRDPIPYLISCGYGAIRNARTQENSRCKMKVCPKCGSVFSYRRSECPHCMCENDTENRLFSTTLNDGSDVEFEDASSEDWLLLNLDVAAFVRSLYGKEKYVAKRWLVDRADVRYANHLKQIGLELGCSAVYVAHLKKAIRKKWQALYGKM